MNEITGDVYGTAEEKALVLPLKEMTRSQILFRVERLFQLIIGQTESGNTIQRVEFRTNCAH